MKRPSPHVPFTVTWLRKPRPPLSLTDDWGLCLIFFFSPTVLLVAVFQHLRAGAWGQALGSMAIAAICVLSAVAYLRRPITSGHE